MPGIRGGSFRRPNDYDEKVPGRCQYRSALAAKSPVIKVPMDPDVLVKVIDAALLSQNIS